MAMNKFAVMAGYFSLVFSVCLVSIFGKLPFWIFIPLTILLPALIAGLRAGKRDSRLWLTLSVCGLVAPFAFALVLAFSEI
jgi:hypothetical protein